MAKVLVAGGAGYIGSHVALLLSRRGYDPIIYDNMSGGHPWAVTGDLIKGDIRDRPLLSAVLDDFKPIAIMHFAGLILVGESMEKPELYFSNNVAGSLNLIELASERGIPFIFSSSAAVYGTPPRVPITEDSPMNPESVYGETKLMVERALAWYSRLRGLRYVSLRYFNAAGASPSGGLGELHRPETHLIPLCLHAVIGLRKSLTLFGNDYPTPDGTCIRDYIHVDDLAEAHILALEHILSGGDSRVYNLGSEQGHSNLEVIETVGKIVGMGVPWVLGPRRPGDPPVLLADSTRIRSELGWRPRYSLEEMIKHAWEFLKAHEGIARRIYAEDL
ncbi:MAG: UDP-glucose 4-epimerase GalE [candidate division WOR-3 bacterium]